MRRRRVLIAAAVARAVATLGMSAGVPFKIRSGWSRSTPGSSISPRCDRAPAKATSSIAWTPTSTSGTCRRFVAVVRSARRSAGSSGVRAMLPVISDFLFDDASAVVRNCRCSIPPRTIFLVVIDSAFAFDLPDISAGWVEIVDVETGQARDDLASRLPRPRRAGATLAGRRRERWRKIADWMW
jgi:hypothetical protein